MCKLVILLFIFVRRFSKYFTLKKNVLSLMSGQCVGVETISIGVCRRVLTINGQNGKMRFFIHWFHPCPIY
jgi:hypothetical protein